MDCTAFLVGLDNKQGSIAYETAQRAGFSTIKPFTSLADVEKQTVNSAICFFLFEEVSDILSLSETIKPIRLCKRHDVRFFPLIYLCDEPSSDIIRQCISNGFDDIIVNPKTNSNIKQRLIKQLDSIITYFETDSFFGPDRRRIADINLSKNANLRGKEKCLQIKFTRNVQNGSAIKSSIVQAA